MIDTFGAGIPHGGGAFCGKDVSKVDKTGILWATKIAEEYSSNNNLIEVLVELNFKIGDSYPKVFVNGDCIEVNQTLNEFIDEYNIKNNKWSELVINGSSVLSWLKGVNK